MKVISLQAENLKRVKAIQITPSSNMISIGGKNGAGKSTVLDALYIAIKGRSVAPPQPIRDGQDVCRIRLDMGELKVTRTFTAKEGGTYTDTLKVENAEGFRASNPQAMLDALFGDIGFDPFALASKKPDDLAAALLQLVPLSVDLDELAEADDEDRAARLLINRDVKTLEGQIAGIPVEEVPAEAPDRAALIETLTNASATNSGIDRERRDREDTARVALGRRGHADELREEAERQRQISAAALIEAARLEKCAEADIADAVRVEAELEALPALADPVDAAAIQQQIREADAVAEVIARQARRTVLVESHTAKAAESKTLTDAMAAREKQRNDALADATMPIDGLSFGLNAKGSAIVLLDGVPFEQGSKAQKLRASTAIAMAANPTLRVLRIEDGSLLDEDSLALLTEMAETEDYQLFCEFVGSYNSNGEAVGILMEDGSIVGADTPEPIEPVKAPKKAAAKGKAAPAEKAPEAPDAGADGKLL